MTGAALPPAAIRWDTHGVARSKDYGDVYASTAGAWPQAMHVFLRGNRLPERWRHTPCFTILETGFGLGTNFLATWAAWRSDPHRCRDLTFISIEKHPVTLEDLQRAHQMSPEPELVQSLIAQWPHPTANFHILEFDDGRVRLILALGDVRHVLRQVVASVDAFYLDGFAPPKNPQMWDPHLLRSLQRLAARDATLATWCAARSVRDALSSAGFVVERAPGFGHKKDMTVGHFAPTFMPKRAVGREPMVASMSLRGPHDKRALIVGGGLAGAHAAAALARQGWYCTVCDTHPKPAGGASGNPAGIYHPTLHAADNIHSRWLRSAALYAHARYQRWLQVAPDQLRGRCDGMFRATLSADSRWPQDTIAPTLGRAAEGGGLWFPHGGWMDPGALTRWLLSQPGIEWKGQVKVHQLERRGTSWRVYAADGATLGEYPLVVLAGGHQLPALLQSCDQPAWPVHSVRGQVTWWRSPQDEVQSGPPHPMGGWGYALNFGERQVLCGATSQADDDDANLRAEDHAFNLDRFRRLTGRAGPAPEVELHGRVGWRLVTQDRLPAVGPLPLNPAISSAGPFRRDQARTVAREPGLCVLGALGSRGLTWAALLAQVLVAWVEGLPMPVEADLLDAVDPARFQVRAFRSEAQ